MTRHEWQWPEQFDKGPMDESRLDDGFLVDLPCVAFQLEDQGCASICQSDDVGHCRCSNHLANAAWSMPGEDRAMPDVFQSVVVSEKHVIHNCSGEVGRKPRLLRGTDAQRR